jgi:hypothetical protein
MGWHVFIVCKLSGQSHGERRDECSTLKVYCNLQQCACSVFAVLRTCGGCRFAASPMYCCLRFYEKQYIGLAAKRHACRLLYSAHMFCIDVLELITGQQFFLSASAAR